ncbi:phosphoglucosamine mutase [Gammaproteobacteria bacterium]
MCFLRRSRSQMGGSLVKKKYFGTDGIRGRVGRSPITADFVLKLGWAAGRVLVQGHDRNILIGKDTRISGYMFESALQAGLSAAGVDIRLLGPMPTPAIAYLTRTLHARAGIVISASHNPYYDNGIKFFSAQGTKLPDETELAIEAALDNPMETVDSADLGKAERILDAGGRYIEFCKSTIANSIEFAGLKLVVDCANGATYRIASSVFQELGARVISTGIQPDGLNINDKCGSNHPEHLQQLVREHHADVGVALDGDGDRVVMVDDKGELLDGDELLYIMARQRSNRAELRGTVVGTVMSNLGLEHALAEMGLALKRAAVGDRYVLEMLQQGGWILGGESSGHIICLDRTTTGDGIISALQILAAMVQSGRSLHELKQGMHKYPQRMINVPLSQRMDITSLPQVRSAVAEAEAVLAGTGRILLRSSGTEPLVRVMVEGTDAAQVEKMARQLADVVSTAVAEKASSVG